MEDIPTSTQNKLLIKSLLSSFVDLSKETKGQLILGGVHLILWPFRLFIAVAALMVYFAAQAVQQAAKVLFTVTVGLSLAVLPIPAFLINLPYRIVMTPSYVWENRAKIGHALLNNSFNIVLSLIAAAAIVGLTYATFGLAPILLGIAGATTFITAFTVNHLFSATSPIIRSLPTVILAAVAVTAVTLSVIGGGPLIPTLLPFALPVDLGIQVAIVASASLVATIFSAALNGLTTFFTKSSKQQSSEVGGQRLLTTEKEKDGYAIVGPSNSYLYIFKTEQAAQGYLSSLANQNLSMQTVQYVKVKDNSNKSYYLEKPRRNLDKEMVWFKDLGTEQNMFADESISKQVTAFKLS